MADLKSLKSCFESESYESFSLDEHLFSLLDLSLSIGYNNPSIHIQTPAWYPSQDTKPISTNISADRMFEVSLNIEANTLTQGDVLWNENTGDNNNQVETIEDEIPIRTNSIEDPDNPVLVMHEDHNTMKDTTRNKRGYRYYKNGVVNTLTWEVIKPYFYSPITKAAKELNVGLTFLKKRCREFGISRWPHRKLMSLQNAINNLKDELENVDGEVNKGKLRRALESLEMERKRIEENPDLELGDKTMRLIQSCFKTNYKRKRVISSTSSTSRSNQL